MPYEDQPERFTESREFYDVRATFETQHHNSHRLDRESKEYYARGAFYQDGETNKIFKAYLNGYQLGRATYMN